jgi:RNA polymerase sigma factor (sigma-70 family)
MMPGDRVGLGGTTHQRSQLVDKLRRGDKQATDSVVIQLRDEAADNGDAPGLFVVQLAFREPVTRWLQKKGLANEATVADIWNDTLLRVHLNVDAFDATRSSFRTWVFNQARYAALDYGRRSRRISDEAESLSDEMVRPRRMREPASYDEDPVVERLDEDQRKALVSAWRRLSDTERELLRLRIVDGYGNVEIARGQLEGRIPEDHVRVYFNRALRRLRQFFDDEMGR